MLLPVSDIISLLNAPSAASMAGEGMPGADAAQQGVLTPAMFFSMLLQGISLPGAPQAGQAVEGEGEAAAGDGAAEQSAGLAAWLFPIAALASPPSEPGAAQAAAASPEGADHGVAVSPALAGLLPEALIAALNEARAAMEQHSATSQPAAGAPQAAPAVPQTMREALQNVLASALAQDGEPRSAAESLQRIQEALVSSGADKEGVLQKVLAALQAQSSKPSAAPAIPEEGTPPALGLPQAAPKEAALAAAAAASASSPVPAEGEASAALSLLPRPQPVRAMADEGEEEEGGDALSRALWEHAPSKRVAPAAAPEKPASLSESVMRQIQSVNVLPQAVSLSAPASAESAGASGVGGEGWDLSAMAGSVTSRLSHFEAARAQELPQPQAARPLHPAVEQVAIRISQGVQEGVDKIHIRLDPQDLGRVDVRLDVSSDGKVSVNVIASNRESLEALQAHSRHLEKALIEAGLKADTGSMSFGYRGDPQAQQEQLAGQMPQLSQYRAPEEAGETAVQEVTLTYRPAHSRELDIKV